MKKILSFCCLVLFLTACTQYPIRTQLNTAESLLQESPDSCLSILRTINADEIKTRKEKARHALLLSAALDKNYIDVTSDSLIRTATDYYADSHDMRRRMMSNYYRGIILKNSDNLHAAILCLEKAEKDAESLSDYYYLGLILRNKSDIYNRNFNNREAIQNDLAAISAFDHANKYTHKEYACLSLAIDYVNGGKYREAAALLDSLETICTDSNLLYQVRLFKAETNVDTDININESVDIYRSTPSFYLSFLHFAKWALACEYTHQKDSADLLIARSYSSAQSKADTATIDYIHSKIQRNRGHFDHAYQLVNNALNIQDSLTRVRLNHSFDQTLTDYYKNETDFQEQKNQQMKARLWWISIASLLCILLLCSLIIMGRQRHNSQIKEYLALFAARSTQLDKAIKQNASLVGSLLSERLYHLDELSEAYYANDNEATKEALFKEFKLKVFALRDDNRLFSELEKDLDTNCNGLMSKFRAQVPAVKGENVKMALLFFAGIPYKAIQMILRKNSVESLRTAKSRLRRAVIDSHGPDASLFLKLLESE